MRKKYNLLRMMPYILFFQYILKMNFIYNNHFGLIQFSERWGSSFSWALRLTVIPDLVVIIRNAYRWRYYCNLALFFSHHNYYESVLALEAPAIGY